jgi:exosome complex component RRP4
LEQYGADLILGCKLGFVWVGEHVKAMDSTTIEDQLNNTEQQLIKYKTTSKDNMLQESRQSRCRIANAIHVLSSLGFSLTLEVIMETIDLSSALNLGIDEMLRSNLYEIWNSMTK